MSPHSDEHRAKISEALRQFYASQEAREANRRRSRAYHDRARAAMAAMEAERAEEREDGAGRG